MRITALSINSIHLCCAGAAAVAVCFVAPCASAQISELYLNTHGDGAGTVFVVRGGVIQRQWSAGDASGSLFVNSTVRTAGNTGGGGEEFTQAGVATGTTFPNPGTLGMHVDDSTTDGTFAYGFDYAAQRVVRFNLDWSNPTTLFSVGPVNGRCTVTYDPTDNTLWTTGWTLAQMDHYSMTGQIIASYSLPTSQRLALALDHADNTLWMSQWGTNVLYQYSKTGQLLQTVTVAGLADTISGGEFALPAPGATALLGMSGLLAARRRRS